MKNLFILTGPINSGKTTKLMQWAAAQKNIDGIFQPVIDDKRFIYHISSRTLKILETKNTKPENDIVTIGRYQFRKSVFNWAQNILNDCVNKKLNWLIIDEIGPLELDGKGLEPIISKIFNEIDKLSGNVLCVVRDSILNKFVEQYRLENKYELFNLDQD